jgi:hypothetical protein
MAGEAERKRAGYRFGEDQTPEAAEAIWLGQSAAIAETME